MKQIGWVLLTPRGRGIASYARSTKKGVIRQVERYLCASWKTAERKGWRVVKCYVKEPT